MKLYSTLNTLLVGLLWAGSLMATEEPKFESLRKDDNIELRLYAPHIVAETVVEGDLENATSRGFRILADYIFGNNERIAMTAPVVAEPQSGSEKIAMTAPVTVEPRNDKNDLMAGATSWRIHFVMPSAYSLETLPKPINPQVQLRQIPSKTYAALTYSGLNSEAKVQEKTDELLSWLARQNLTPQGKPQLARYNPPWTLPMLRRNEILQEVQP